MALIRDAMMKTPNGYSWFDLSRTNGFDANPGWLYPCFADEVLPGDTWYIDISNDISTAPLLAPLKGSFTQEIAFFFVPTRLYVQNFDVNSLNFDIINQTLPVCMPPCYFTGFTTATTYPMPEKGLTGRCNLGSMLDMYPENYIEPLPISGNSAYLTSTAAGSSTDWPGGIAVKPAILQPLLDARVPLNAECIIGYYDIFRNYYSNPQEEFCYGCFAPYQSTYTTSNTGVPTGFDPLAETMIDQIPLKFFDDFILRVVNLSSNVHSGGIGLFQDSEGSMLVDVMHCWNVTTLYYWNNTNTAAKPGSYYGYTSTSYAPSFPTCSYYDDLGLFVGNYITNDTVRNVAMRGWANGNTASSGFKSFGVDVVGYGTAARTYGGLMLRTHKPDMFTAWFNSQTYQKMLSRAAIATDNNQFTMQQLWFGSHLADYLTRGMLSGGRYSDWVYSQFGVKCDQELCIPELLGVFRSSINFGEVTCTAGDNLGELAGKGYGSLNGKRISFTANENGHVIGIYSIVPNVSYSQSAHPMYERLYYSDIFSESMDNIGFQSLPNRWLSAFASSSNNAGQSLSYGWPRLIGSGTTATSTPVKAPMQIVGVQPAWQEYMTAVDRVHGSFSVGSDLDYWKISRNFVAKMPQDISNTGIQGSDSFNATSYVLPWQYNYPFADQDVSAGNFLVSFLFNTRVRRGKSKNPMPTLA